MQRYFQRIVFAALTSLMIMPMGVQAQEQSKDQSQSSQQTDGSRRRGRAGMQRQRQHMAMLAEKLNLTDAQKAQFQQIGKDTRKQGMAIRQDSSLTDDQKKEKMQELRKQSHKQMFGVLTPEQKKSSGRCASSTRKSRGKTSLLGIRLPPGRNPEAQVTRTIPLRA